MGECGAGVVMGRGLLLVFLGLSRAMVMFGYVFGLCLCECRIGYL